MFCHSARPGPSLWSITEPNSFWLSTRGSCQGFTPQHIASTHPISTLSFTGTWDASWVRQMSVSHVGRGVICSRRWGVFVHVCWCSWGQKPELSLHKKEVLFYTKVANNLDLLQSWKLHLMLAHITPFNPPIYFFSKALFVWFHITILTSIFKRSGYTAVTKVKQTPLQWEAEIYSRSIVLPPRCWFFAEDVAWVGSLSVWLQIDSLSHCWKKMAAYGFKLTVLNRRARNPVVGLISVLSNGLQKH